MVRAVWRQAPGACVHWKARRRFQPESHRLVSGRPSCMNTLFVVLPILSLSSGGLGVRKRRKYQTQEKKKKKMGKTRMTAVDLRAAVSELSQKLVGQRLQNIYDINSKMYLLKFSGKGDQKEFVVIEVGSRIHSTTFSFDKPKVPTGFTLKIRKHIRQWRLDSLRQLGCDRVVEFSFGSGENTFRLIIEFYAKGNLILTDHSYSILGLVRTHSTEDAKYAVRATYPTTDIQLFRPMVEERMEETFKSVEEGEGSVSLKTAFTNSTEYGPAFVEHCLLKAGARPNFKKKGAADAGRQVAPELLKAFAEPDAFLRDVPTPLGYLIRRLKPDEVKDASTTPDKSATRASAESYEDFAPVLYKQHEADGLQVEKFDTFNEACDYYFSAIDQGAVQQHNEKSKKAALTKVEKAIANHKRRIEELEKEQNKNLIKAQLIESNADDVEAALAIIRSAVGRAVDWTELSRIIREQKRIGNPIASIIHELKLEKNKVALLLTLPEEEDDDGNSEVHVVEVDIGLSAHANARNYFGVKKKVQEKQAKTQAAEGKAIESANRKAEKQAKKKTHVPKKDIVIVRKVLWFEKFNWFISSENYLILSGRDAQQNELLVKRYLKKGDIYVHGDIHGAATTIIKNPSSQGVPPDTLYQAGNMAVCRSSAWESNIVISAWWVHHNQVSKTAPSGEYMPTGAFMIRGKKNFLPPTKLQMGAALLFRVHNEHVERHRGERCPVDWDHEPVRGDGSSTGAPTMSVAPSICAASEAPSSIHCGKNLLERYGLNTDAYNEDGVAADAPALEEPQPEAVKPAVELVSKVRMSAKERRMKKKAAVKQEDNEEEAEAKPKPEKRVGITIPEEAAHKNKDAEKEKPKKGNNAPLSRAEKRKAKKLAKYADQDEEEKELKMRLCGWDGGLKGMNQVEDEQEEEEEKKAIRTFDDDDAFRKDGTPTQHKQKQEVKEILMELDLLDTLTGIPLEDDLLLHPLLMVGPVEAVENFKYRVNILPGKDKKGKAANQLLHHFSQSIVATEQERTLIKHMDMQDCINLLPSNLRIVTDADLANPKGGKKGGR
eukprot:TRINITY_DN7880_c0_g4_i1.p1 TRINITY_DN7880_c0_g4~~TRINITY_DN7880_c0_g4_i1.p1  ORF type:complete len:1058 (+),score=267.93 TRINITY_DN7880_c0_g4_i1:169-3342(+)